MKIKATYNLRFSLASSYAGNYDCFISFIREGRNYIETSLTTLTVAATARDFITYVSNIALVNGTLVGVTISARTGTSPVRGQAFARAELYLGPVTNVNYYGALISKYVVGITPVTWTAGSNPVIEDSLSGVGYLYTPTIISAVGSEFIIAPAANSFWKIHALYISLVCSAVVATRYPSFRYKSGSTILGKTYPAPAGVVAGTTTNFSLYKNLLDQSTSGQTAISFITNEYGFVLPFMGDRLALSENESIASVTTGIDTTAVTGDAYTVNALVEEFILIN